MTKNPPESRQRLLPRLSYDDAPAAIEFLTSAFGFEETGRFAPEGVVVYAEIAMEGETLFAVGTSHEGVESPKQLGGLSIELFCSVDDVDAHHERALAAGATITSPPEDKFWGDRSYSARDSEGYLWIFRKLVKHVVLPDSKPT